jgi:hypothetical protein
MSAFVMPGLVPDIHAVQSNVSLTLESAAVRHDRACPGHPRRDVQSKCENLAPTVTTESVGVLKKSRRSTAWIPGTRPGMTRIATGKRLNLAHRGTSPAMTESVVQHLRTLAIMPTAKLRRRSPEQIAPPRRFRGRQL